MQIDIYTGSMTGVTNISCFGFLEGMQTQW